MIKPVTTFQEALDYLYSFIDPVRLATPQRDLAARSLERVQALLTVFGNPERTMPSVVVAGTKGKGSTSAMIESIVRAAGYRTGLWTSPHLNTYRERIQIDRSPISAEDFVAGVREIQLGLRQFDQERYGKPSTFDLGFVLAMRYFAQRRIDLAVLEVGLGGRYDCANVVTPLISVITSISYDHMAVLGDTLAEIAWNKAGIIKPGVPAVTAVQRPEARVVLKQEAEQAVTMLWEASELGLRALVAEGQPEATRFFPVAADARLRGPFQTENARVALGSALLLRDAGLHISDAAISAGLATVEWPGRLEVVARSPLIILDGAHNGDSAEKLATALRTEFECERLIFVLGMSRDKDVVSIAKALVPHADEIVLTHSRHPRAAEDLPQLAALVAPLTQAHLSQEQTVAAAIERARGLATANDLICVTGSLFIVGEAREALGIAVSE